MGEITADDTLSKENTERMRYFHAKYISYSRAVSVMWAVLCMCHLIITMVCFVQPSWLETTDQANTVAYFGLWKYAVADPEKGVMEEVGGFLSFDTMASDKFSTLAILIGVSIILGCLQVITLGLGFCLSSNVVFMACGWMMAGSGLLLGMAGAMFPTGWASSTISSVCKSSSFDSGVCTIGKSYVLAGVAACDAVVMAVLAFILAYRQVTLLPWTEEEEEEENGGNGKNKK